MADATISHTTLVAILDGLTNANADIARYFPGELETRQPVHTVYGGAHLFSADLPSKLGAGALAALRDYAPDAAGLAAAFELPDALAQRIYPRLVHKLQREPVEDFRIDFEDGFGTRPDEEEDRYARGA